MIDPSEVAPLWQQGIIAAWYLRDDQFPIYELLLREKNPFIECSRRYGKTTTILCYVFERLIQNPGWICRWCEPNKNQAREIVIEEVDKIQALIPKELRFQWTVTDSVYIHPISKSKMYLRGVNEDRGDSARGPTSNIIVADEFGTWNDPDYIVQSALRPQLDTTDGPFITASTPPDDLGHSYYGHKERAIRLNRFIQRIIYDNAALSPERIAEIMAEVGGEKSPAWQREYLCKPVSDPERLVVPEYDEKLHDFEGDYTRPAFFDSYVGMDLGFNDHTAALFGYWDFKERTLIIEDEYVANGRNSREITDSCKAKEAGLWGSLDVQGNPVAPTVYRRVSDNDKQQIWDMMTMCGYTVMATRKDDKEAAINALRLRFTAGKIKIHKRCESLRYQLKVGLWNSRRSDFERGEKTGHLDAVDALIYLSRNLDEQRNPYPPVAYDRSTQYKNPSQAPGDSAGLAKALLPFGGLRVGRQ